MLVLYPNSETKQNKKKKKEIKNATVLESVFFFVLSFAIIIVKTRKNKVKLFFELGHLSKKMHHQNLFFFFYIYKYTMKY